MIKEKTNAQAKSASHTLLFAKKEKKRRNLLYIKRTIIDGEEKSI